MDHPQASQPRELVFCHQCDNEWYREEHGIICPECNSDFTEIIEANSDPRQEHDSPPFGDPHSFFAPDPDEADIDDFEWHQNGPGQPPGGRFTGSFTRNIHAHPNSQHGGLEGGIGAGLMGLLGPALQGVFGGQRQGQQQGENMQYRQGEGGTDRSASDPTWTQHEQQQRGSPGTFVRHASGPGYSYTITTSSNSNLFPRDANGPQRPLNHPDHLNHMMAQMFANIGAVHGHGFEGGAGGMHGGPMFTDIGGGPHGGPRHDFGGPLDNLFQILGIAPGGIHGDAVYSQEGLDRIISQLMEQHRSGNAPPPASAEAIESLPKRPISQKDQDDSGKADCSICMDEAELGNLVTELPCGHWFHHDCIKAWLGEHDTCPHCRQGITPKDCEGADGRARQPSQAALHDIHRDQFANESPSNTQGGGGSSAQRGGESSGGLFGRLRQTFSPSGSNTSTQGDSHAPYG